MYRQSYFPAILALTHTLKYVNKASHFANNLYFGHNERPFQSGFHSRVKFRSKFIVHDSESTFHSGARDCGKEKMKNGMKNGLNSVCRRLFSRAELTNASEYFRYIKYKAICFFTPRINMVFMQVTKVQSKGYTCYIKWLIKTR